MSAAASFAIPLAVAVILAAGIRKRIPLFDVFLEGAQDGLRCAVRLAAPVAGLILAVSAFEASGALDLLVRLLAPAAGRLGIPPEVMPLGLLRPVSGSGALALLTALFEQHAPDSPVGRTASVIMGSSETTFYTIAVYYGACGVKHGRYTAVAALAADLAAFLAGALVVSWGL